MHLNPYCALLLLFAALPSAQAADRDALRHIVQDECLPHWRARHEAAPCEQLVLRGPDAQDGYAVLADRKGGAHFLLIPTLTVSGVEDPALLRATSPNYFAAAWTARTRMDAVVGHPLRREAVGLAINSSLTRGQDQLHIHIECLRPEVYRALHTAAALAIGSRWTTLWIEGSPFQALRMSGEELDAANPFRLLADSVPEARRALGAYTMLVAGMQFRDGPGFLLLAGRTPTRTQELLGIKPPGLVAPGETLLDSSCAIDRRPTS
jgi:CDP-diacylglycerol pyrophosphatase